MGWYTSNIKTAVVGLTPFDGAYDLTEKSVFVPWAGGDTHSGVLEPSDNSETHHMNDYFSESKKDALVEKLLQDKKLNKKKKKIKKTTTIKNTKKSFANLWYNQFQLKKESQFGEKGPLLPTFGSEDWVEKTYEKITNIGDNRKQKKEVVPNIENTLIDVHGMKNGQGFCINENIILTSNAILGKDKPKIVKDGKTYQSFVLTSNPELDIAVLVVANPDFKVENPAKLGDSSVTKASRRVSHLPGSPVLTNDGTVAGVLSFLNKVIPINDIKQWLRSNGVDFIEN